MEEKNQQHKLGKCIAYILQSAWQQYSDSSFQCFTSAAWSVVTRATLSPKSLALLFDCLTTEEWSITPMGILFINSYLLSARPSFGWDSEAGTSPMPASIAQHISARFRVSLVTNSYHPIGHTVGKVAAGGEVERGIGFIWSTVSWLINISWVS